MSGEATVRVIGEDRTIRLQDGRFEDRLRPVCRSLVSDREMNIPTTELLLRVNGIQAAFGIEFGLDSPRANEGRAGDPYRQANVSYSLVQRQDGQVVRHTLIDCGMGVVPSLLEFEHTPRRPRRPRGSAHPSALRPFRPARLAVDVPAAERPAGPAPAAADLRQPGVLGERPQPRPPLPGRAERLPAASAGHRRRAGRPHRHALRRGPRPEGPRCPGLRRPARQPEDRHHGRLPAASPRRTTLCSSTPT